MFNSQRRTAWILGSITPPLACALGTGWLWRQLPSPLGTGCLMILMSLLVTVIITDSCWKKIPNWATYPCLLWLLVFNACGSFWQGEVVTRAIPSLTHWSTVGPTSLGAIGLANCLSGALVCFGVMVVLSGWLKSSGGDVKLLTVIGACIGVRYGLMALALGYILAGCYSLMLCIWHYGLLSILRGTLAWLGNLIMPLMIPRPQVRDDKLLKSGVPLGAHFALGTVLALTPIIPGLHS